MKKTYVWHGALLTMTTAFAVGCGGAGEPTDLGGEYGSDSQAMISSIAPAVVSGCNLTMAFDIVGPNNIGFIAIKDLNKAVSNSSSSLNNMQLTLYQLDNLSNVTQVNKQATQLDSRLSAMLNQISENGQFARQSASATEFSDSHFAQYADVNRQVLGSTTTTTDQKEVLNQNQASEYYAKHSAEEEAASRGSAYNRNAAENLNKNAVQQEAAFNASNWSKEGLQSNAFAANNAWLALDSSYTALGIDPSTFLSKIFNDVAKQSVSESAYAAQNVSQDSLIASQQANANRASQDSATYQDQAARSRAATEDHVKDRTDVHLDHAVSASQTTSTDQVLRETTSIVTDQRAKAGVASDNIAEARDYSRNFVNQQEASSMAQSAFGFSNLEDLQSNHFILKVDIAADQQEAAFELFQGLNDSVWANTTFTQGLPACY